MKFIHRSISSLRESDTLHAPLRRLWEYRKDFPQVLTGVRSTVDPHSPHFKFMKNSAKPPDQVLIN